MSLQIILIWCGVAGTIYIDYTIKPLINLGLIRQNCKSLAIRLSCYAIQRLTANFFTGHALNFQGRRRCVCVAWCVVEVGRRKVWASRSMAKNPPDHQ
eukprot:1147689-Pelagomonas_calceolata.AAC.6